MYNYKKKCIMFLLVIVIVIMGWAGWSTYFDRFDQQEYHINENLNIKLSTLPESTQKSLLNLEKKVNQELKDESLLELKNFFKRFNKNIITADTPLIFKKTADDEILQKNVILMPDFLTGLEISQLKSLLNNWYVKDFQQDQYLILSQKISDSENEIKYIIGIEDNRVAIYSREDDNKLLQVTEIKIEKLPQSEKKNLKKGIRVNSDEELFAILEGLVSYYQD